MSETNYRQDASDDAKETARNFLDEIVEQIVDTYEASEDLFNDYPDGDAYHHESHVDKYYNLQEAADLLHQLRDYKETDSGIWEGLEPEEAIGAQAAYTYGNAVMSYWQELIGEINGAGQDVVDEDKWEKMEEQGVDEDKIEAAKKVEVKAAVEAVIEAF